MSKPSLRLSRIVVVMIFLAGLTGACRLGAQPATESPSPQTLAPTATLPVAAAPLVQPTREPVPTAAPTAEVQPTISAIIKDTLRKFDETMGLPQGKIYDIGAGKDGNVWLATESGAFAGMQGFWGKMLDEPTTELLGMDTKGRLWVLLNDGARIAYQEGEIWRIFDAGKGWAPVPPAEYLSPGFGDSLMADNQGWVWFATGRNELRRFEPMTDTWKVYRAEDLKFEPPDLVGYQGHFLTDVVVSKMGKVWVSDCIGEGESLTGQGIRRLDGDLWNPVPPTLGQCIMDMEVDSRGSLWVSTFDKIMRYDSDTGDWSDFPLPEGGRTLVTTIDLDQNDQPWIEIARAGGASLFGSSQRLHLGGASWIIDYDPGMYVPSSLAFDPDGKAWMCAAGQLMQITPAGSEVIAALNASSCKIAFDGGGKGWVLALGGADEGLWIFTP